MPNGSDRALINQRSVTLALPFAAKTGDSIELEVTESDGKLTLAVVAREAAGAGKAGNESATTSLSRTGQLISNLLVGNRDAKGGPAALPLNGNQPIAAAPPTSAQALQPLLEQAITQSGMFYEAHQAEWVEGRYSKEQLLQEPQGRLAPQVPTQELPAPPGSPAAGAARSMASAVLDGAPMPMKFAEENTAPMPIKFADANAATIQPGQVDQPVAPQAQALVRPGAIPDNAPVPIKSTEANTGTIQRGQVVDQPVAPQAQAIVQQQLEAFATQSFSWQGQVWPCLLYTSRCV